ncbi:hypothetical protein RJ641_007155, partial [Dillenia turbinata]
MCIYTTSPSCLVGWILQSRSPRDICRMSLYGIHLPGFGTFDEHNLTLLCNTRKNTIKTVHVSSLKSV